MEHGKQERSELYEQEEMRCVELKEADKKSDEKQRVGTRTERDYE